MNTTKLVILSSAITLSVFTSSSSVKSLPTLPCANTGLNSNNLVVCSATYLGSNTNDSGVAVEITPSDKVVIAANIPGNNFGKTPINLKAGSSTTLGGNGAVIMTDYTGKTVISVTRLGNNLYDLDVNRSLGQIAVVGDFGLAVLNPQGTQVLWSKTPTQLGNSSMSNTARVTVGNNGNIAVLSGNKVTIFKPDGNLIATNSQFSISGTVVNDITLHDASNSLIATGYTQKDGGSCTPVQVAFLRSYSYTGSIKWTNYDWSNSSDIYKIKKQCADTRGIRVTIGRDNKLYFAGESAGGNTIYSQNPRDLNNAPNVKFDQYNDPYNTSSNHITYYGKFDPATGIMSMGQFALSRLSTGAGNTIRPNAITADEKGNIYITGVSAAFSANRNSQSISSKFVGNYVGGDGFLLVVSPDFKTRKIWTTWTGTNTSTSLQTTLLGVAAGQNIAAIIGTSNGNMITVNPFQGTNPGGLNAFFSVFPGF